jgi:hypothetical protein
MEVGGVGSFVGGSGRFEELGEVAGVRKRGEDGLCMVCVFVRERMGCGYLGALAGLLWLVLPC